VICKCPKDFYFHNSGLRLQIAQASTSLRFIWASTHPGHSRQKILLHLDFFLTSLMHEGKPMRWCWYGGLFWVSWRTTSQL